MAMSIAHRATGIANYAGTVLLVIWLGAAASGQEALNLVNEIYGSWFGQLVLFVLHALEPSSGGRAVGVGAAVDHRCSTARRARPLRAVVPPGHGRLP